jgi:hypothetical protein
MRAKMSQQHAPHFAASLCRNFCALFSLPFPPSSDVIDLMKIRLGAKQKTSDKKMAQEPREGKGRTLCEKEDDGRWKNYGKVMAEKCRQVIRR